MPHGNRIDLKTARREAYLTQEQAAEAVDVSLESWKAYEYGQRIPPNEVVVKICEVLDAPWLALEYLKLSSQQLGVLPEGIELKALPVSVLQFINQAVDLADDYRDLMRIAEDGVIDGDESGRFAEISEKVRRLIATGFNLIYSPESRDLAQKKTASMREHRSGLVQGLTTENDCKNYYSTSARKSKAQFSRKGGASL